MDVSRVESGSTATSPAMMSAEKVDFRAVQPTVTSSSPAPTFPTRLVGSTGKYDTSDGHWTARDAISAGSLRLWPALTWTVLILENVGTVILPSPPRGTFFIHPSFLKKFRGIWVSLQERMLRLTSPPGYLSTDQREKI